MLCAAGCTVQTTAVVTVCDIGTLYVDDCMNRASCMASNQPQPLIAVPLIDPRRSAINQRCAYLRQEYCLLSHRTIARTAPLPPATPALRSRSSCRPSFRWPRSHAASVSARRLPTALPAYAMRLLSGRGWRCSNSATPAVQHKGWTTDKTARRASERGGACRRAGRRSSASYVDGMAWQRCL